MANIISAEKALGQKAMLEFSKDLTDDAIITMYIEQTNFVREKPFKNMVEFFAEDDIAQFVPSDDCVIQFLSDANDSILQIVGFDWKWWRQPFRKQPLGRIAQYHLLDKNVEEKQDKKKREKVEPIPETLHTIKVGCKLSDGSIEEYDTLTGNKKQLIAFINTKYAEIQLKTLFEAIPVFAIDNDEYFEFDALVEKGVFVS